MVNEVPLRGPEMQQMSIGLGPWNPNPQRARRGHHFHKGCFYSYG